MTAASGEAIAVGVTGGIGSGKSTFCRFLKQLPGVAYVDADRIVRGLLSGSPAVRAAIEQQFGPGVLGPTGWPDRQQLAARVFADRCQRRSLEQIIHPRVRCSLARRVGALKRREGIAIVVAEIPLLTEAGRPAWCDLVVSVEAGKEQRLRRLERRGVSRQQAQARMAHQASDAARRAAADLVVCNDGEIRELEQGARRLWERLFSQRRGLRR
jgi:dephospho-CoA kinase